MYTMCCDIWNYFVKKAQFCHFVRGPWIFSILQFCQNAQLCHCPRGPWMVFNFSILSRIVHFVICEKWTSNFNFVKNWPFCHLWKGDFKLWDKDKYTVCTLCVVIYQIILSKRLNFVIIWETRIVFWMFFNIVKSYQLCHFLRGLCFFFSLEQYGCCFVHLLHILSKMKNVVIREKRTSNYEIGRHSMCSDVSNCFLFSFVLCWGLCVI